MIKAMLTSVSRKTEAPNRHDFSGTLPSQDRRLPRFRLRGDGARRGRTRQAAARLALLLRLEDEDHHEDDAHDEAEGGFLAVPMRRLPHGEPLAGDDEKAHEPDEKSEETADGGPELGRRELGGAGAARAPERDGAPGERQPAERLEGDDQSIGETLQRRRGDGPVHQRVAREDR